MDLDQLTTYWVRLGLTLFRPFEVGSRLVVLADGIKAPKEGKRMPGVKRLHQQSANNSRPAYCMGHSLLAISLLVQVQQLVTRTKSNAVAYLQVPAPLRRGDGDPYLLRTTDAYRAAIRRKLSAYPVYVQLRCIAQGPLQHLSLNHTAEVWRCFRSRLRTMNPSLPPNSVYCEGM